MSEYTDKMHSPSPAHGGTSAIRVADDCLDSVLSAAECDCIPNEFQCVKHGAMDELRTLRARLAALTRENERLRTVFECEAVAYKRVCAERDAERSRAEKARGALADALQSWSFDEGQRHTHTWHTREDWIERHPMLRALAQPRAERETTTEAGGG